MRRLLTIAAFLPCVACGAGPATTPLAPTDGDSDSNTTSDNTARPTHGASELAKIRSFKSSVSGLTSSQAASCNGETYAGHCEGDDVIWCDNGQVIEAHCAVAGEVCAWSDADSFYGCVAPSPTGCNGVTYNGNCNGSTAEWCANNALFDLACGDYGGVCQVDSSGLANCAYPAQLGYMPDFDRHESLPIVSMSQDIGAIGGTELRSLVAFDGKLFAANGYWVDSEQSDPGLPGAQILRLDSPGAQWQIEYELDETIANGRRRFYTFASLHRVVMNMDDTGCTLPASVTLAAREHVVERARLVRLLAHDRRCELAQDPARQHASRRRDATAFLHRPSRSRDGSRSGRRRCHQRDLRGYVRRRRERYRLERDPRVDGQFHSRQKLADPHSQHGRMQRQALRQHQRLRPRAPRWPNADLEPRRASHAERRSRRGSTRSDRYCEPFRDLARSC